MKQEINIKITNAKQLIAILEDLRNRTSGRFYEDGWKILDSGLATLIKVLEEAK